MNWLKNIFQESYADANEARFCREWLGHRRIQSAKFVAVIYFLFHIVGLAQTIIFGDLPGVSYYKYFHLISLPLAVFTLVYVFGFRKHLESVTFAITLISTGSYLLTGLWAWPLTPELAPATALVAAVAINSSVAFCPFSRRQIALLATFSVLTIMFVSSYIPDQQLLFFELAVVVFLGSSVGLATPIRLENDAKKEYHRLKRLVPTQIVRQGSDIDTTQLFSPANRSCICIASDWRGYQKISSLSSPAIIADWLRRYYEMCERCLHKHFPEGNFFSDWIADELFVVIFRETGPILEKDIQAAMEFSADLIRAKREFCRLVINTDFGIDIGLSIGEAVIGLLGPESHAKTTALGEMPGQCRRIQTLGKMLRGQISDIDRVLFTDPRFARAIDHQGVKVYDSDRPLRDLQVTSFFYCEIPETAKDQAA